MRKTLLALLTVVVFACSETQENINAIPGMMPVDIYQNFEEQGFTTQENLGTEYGNTWISKLEENGITYNTTVYSMDAGSVETIRASATVAPGQKDIQATKQFFQYTATLPYDNAKPEEAAKWVSEHFNQDGDSVVINGVMFKIFAPTPQARMLDIRKAK